MASFLQYPFTGEIEVNLHNVTWCPISSSKAAIMYSSVINGLSKWFVQIVNFNGSEPPTFGPACSIGNESPLVTYSHPRMAMISGNRIVAAVPNNAGATPTSFRFLLLEIDSSDRIIFINQSVTQIAIHPQGLTIQLEGNRQGTVVAAAATSGISMTLYKIVMTGSELTVTTLGSAGQSSTTQRGTANLTKRRARDGRTWFFRSGDASTSYSSVASVNLDSPTTNLDFKIEISTSAALTLNTRNLLGGCVPVKNSQILHLFNTNTTYRLVDGGVLKYENAFKNAAPDGAVLDVVWLDAEHFMAVMLTGTQLSSGTAGAADATINAYNANLFVGNYNEQSYAIQAADSFPLSLNIPVYNGYWQSCIHQIDANNVALFLPVRIDDSWKFAIQLLSL